MSKVLTGEDIAKMTPEGRKELASRMYSPVKFCGSKLSNKEKNVFIRRANPRWSEEQLRHQLYDEEPIITCKNEIKVQ